MKKRIVFCAIFIQLFAFVGCEPVRFHEPQPANTSDESSFPNRILGRYRSQTDQSVLEIQEKTVIRMTDEQYLIHKTEFDSAMRQTGDSVRNPYFVSKYEVFPAGDSFLVHITATDTLFVFDKYHILRKFKQHYFMNQFVDSTGWIVQTLKMESGKCIISKINSKEEIEKLNEITGNAIDSVPAENYSLTKKQMKTLLKSGGFREKEVFVKEKSE